MKSTNIIQVEVNLSKVPAYQHTKSVSTIGKSWKAFDNNGIKGGKGRPHNDVWLSYEMDGKQLATSWTKVPMTVTVKYSYKTFFKNFTVPYPFSFKVPGPYQMGLEARRERGKGEWTNDYEDPGKETEEWDTYEQKEESDPDDEE